MGAESSIEWTDATWNPVRGCKKISPGCKHCYAETFAERWRGIPGHPYELGFDPRLVPQMLETPLQWKRPRRIFVNSMSDLFQEDVPIEYIHRVFETMRTADWHIYQILTKRSARMREVVNALPKHLVNLPNVWLGVSAEDRKFGLPRLADLRTTKSAIRFVSIEPLIEDLGHFSLKNLDWVIVGGESGPGARPMLEEWVLSVRDQCKKSAVPFFFKQWGGVQKSKNGRELRGMTYNEMPALTVV